jgi:hypothetical protein
MKKLFLLLILTSGVLVINSFAGDNSDKEVLNAYELRMNGKVDEAKALLNSILSKDSTNAMAWYEMARINHYMFIGSGGTTINDISVAIDKAVANDPTNVTYAYYKAIASFLNAFMAMQTGQGDVKNCIKQTTIQFDKVLDLKPDYYEASLYLVEIYGLLPQDMGGDSANAIDYAYRLGTNSQYFGAKALAVLSPEGTNLVKYWEEFLPENGSDPDFLMEAGKASLLNGDPINAEKYFNIAMLTDPSKNVLILDLARYHIMKVMQSPDLAKTELPLAKTYLASYLQTIPAPVTPLKAYTLGLLARIEMVLGNQDTSDKLTAEAKSMDKYFSRASGVPTLMLFDPPDQICYHYFSFFSPY